MAFEWLSNVPQNLPEPLESLGSLVKQVSLEKERVDYKGSERRSKARTSVVLTAWVQPLNESQNPDGDGFLLSSAILPRWLGHRAREICRITACGSYRDEPDWQRCESAVSR